MLCPFLHMIGWHVPYNCCKVLPTLIIGLCTSDSGWTWGVICLLYENCFACRSVGNGWHDSYFTHLEKQVWCMTWRCWELLHVLQDRVWLGYHIFRKMWMQLDQFSIYLLQSAYTSAWGAHWWWVIDCIQNRSHTPFCWIVVVIPFEIWKLGEFYWAVSLHQWPNCYGCWLVQAAIICQKVSHWSFPFFFESSFGYLL